MPDYLKKIWMYLIPLFILGVVATCDSDFSIKNPFSKEPETGALDSASVDSTTNQSLAVEDTLKKQPYGTSPDSLMVEAPSQESDPLQKRRKWRLIVGSLADRDRAEKLADATNHPQTEIMYVEYLDSYRVVYASFEDLREAQIKFSEVQARYPEAWLVYY